MIQGSSSLWDQYPAEMSVALDTHNEVIREELVRFGGYEVKTIGDSFMVDTQHPPSANVTPSPYLYARTHALSFTFC